MRCFSVLFSSFPPGSSVLVVAISVIHMKICRVITVALVCSRLGCSQCFNYVIRRSPISFSWRLFAAFGRRVPGTPGPSAVLGASWGDATRSSWRISALLLVCCLRPGVVIKLRYTIRLESGREVVGIEGGSSWQQRAEDGFSVRFLDGEVGIKALLSFAEFEIYL